MGIIFEGQPDTSKQGEEAGGEKKLPLHIMKFMELRVGESNMFLEGSIGSMSLAAREAMEKGQMEGLSGEELDQFVFSAIDNKIGQLYERSKRRWEPSGITPEQRKELYKKNPRRGATRFMGLRS